MTQYAYKPFYCENINADIVSEDEIEYLLEEDMIINIESLKQVLKNF
jgi:hypothetical protein